MAAFSRALRRSSRRAAVFYSVGNLLSARGKPAQAAAMHSRAIALNGAYFEAYNNLGSALITMANAADMAREPEVRRRPAAIQAPND